MFCSAQNLHCFSVVCDNTNGQTRDVNLFYGNIYFLLSCAETGVSKQFNLKFLKSSTIYHIVSKIKGRYGGYGFNMINHLTLYNYIYICLCSYLCTYDSLHYNSVFDFEGTVYR